MSVDELSLEKSILDKQRGEMEEANKIRLKLAKEMFPDLQNKPHVKIPIRCKLPWGHKRHFFHGDKYGVLTSLWVCLRCGLVAFRLGGGELGDWWDARAGYTDPNKPLHKV